MYGDKKENSKFQSEIAKLIASKGQIDPQVAYCFQNLFIRNIMCRFFRKTKQKTQTGMQLSCLFFFLVLLFMLKSGNQLWQGSVVGSGYNEAGENAY